MDVLAKLDAIKIQAEQPLAPLKEAQRALMSLYECLGHTEGHTTTMGKGEQVPNQTSLDQELPVAQVQWMSVRQSTTQVVLL
jgi:hypothetical protein